MSEESRLNSLSEEQIDGIVVAQAEDDTAWEESVWVSRNAPTAMPLPPKLARRAAFFAQLHKATDVEEWLRNIIRERIDFEEAAFAGLKQSMATKGNI